MIELSGLDTQHSILSTRYSALSTQHSALVTQHSALVTQHSALILEPELVPIPAGDFLMGSASGQADEQPVHRVWVSRFAIGKFPVTNRQYARFLQAAGHSPPETWASPRFNHPDQPVVAISWFDAMAFCGWLSAVCGKSYRLPTEAEWEKAARGGAEGQRYPWGHDLPLWMNPYGRGDAIERPDLVGQDVPNGYGLHNMGDLVHVWCLDWYAADYYRRSPPDNPQGPATGVRRASRGGAWRHRIKVTRCAARSSLPPDRAFTDYGFRVAVSCS
jgi:formylglycine-generating enzyme required for sulfatase activity